MGTQGEIIELERLGFIHAGNLSLTSKGEDLFRKFLDVPDSSLEVRAGPPALPSARESEHLSQPAPFEGNFFRESRGINYHLDEGVRLGLAYP